MKITSVAKQIETNYKSEEFQINVTDESSLARLFQSLILIYKDPFSFVREFVQNAYDAVVELWELKYSNVYSLDQFLIDNPIIVSLLKDNLDKQYIEISETKGIGISPERINNTYKILTKSTKRNSSFQIGEKGIGKLSALAYTDEFFIKTISDNIEYYYKISRKDTNKPPTITLEYFIPTQEENKTSIIVYLNQDSDESLFSNAVNKFLPYFNNIYYNNVFINTSRYYTPSFKNLNDLPLKNYKTFINRQDIYLFDNELHLCIDRIPYRIDWFILGIKRILIPVGLKFSSSELLLNDNRDDIRYLENDAINKIKNRIEEFYKEIYDLIPNNCSTYSDDLNVCLSKTHYININNNNRDILPNAFLYHKDLREYFKNNLFDLTFKKIGLITHYYGSNTSKKKTLQNISSKGFNIFRSLDNYYFINLKKANFYFINDINQKIEGSKINFNDNFLIFELVDTSYFPKLNLQEAEIVVNYINDYLKNNYSLLSSIYEKNKKTIREKTKSNFKADIITGSKTKESVYISEENLINSNIVLFNDTNKARDLYNFLYNHAKFQNVQIAVVADTYYYKYSNYHIENFFQRNDVIHIITILKIRLLKKEFSFKTLEDYKFIKRIFQNTVHENLINEVCNYLFKYSDISYIQYDLLENLNKFKNFLSVDKNMLDKAKEFYKIVDSYPILNAIDKRFSIQLINETVQILVQHTNHV